MVDWAFSIENTVISALLLSELLCIEDIHNKLCWNIAYNKKYVVYIVINTHQQTLSAAAGEWANSPNAITKITGGNG